MQKRKFTMTRNLVQEVEIEIDLDEESPFADQYYAVLYAAAASQGWRTVLEDRPEVVSPAPDFDMEEFRCT